jgi:hypothetical protein
LSWSLNLRDNGATEKEIKILCGPHHYGPCERVELNAMTSDQFIAWLESKLEQHGVEKVVPDIKVLRSAYRRAVFLQQLDAAQAELAGQIKRDKVALPAALAREVKRLLKDIPEMSWDEVVWELAAQARREAADST